MPSSVEEDDSWIVFLNETARARARDLCASANATCWGVYSSVLLGFSASLSRSALADFLTAVGADATAVHADSNVYAAGVGGHEAWLASTLERERAEAARRRRPASLRAWGGRRAALSIEDVADGSIDGGAANERGTDGKDAAAAAAAGAADRAGRTDAASASSHERLGYGYFAPDADALARASSSSSSSALSSSSTSVPRREALVAPPGAWDASYLQNNEYETVFSSPGELSPGSSTRSGRWGLDRIDQVELPLDGMYHYYNLGSNVDVYVIDTGILTTHEEFEYGTGQSGSRATVDWSAYDSDADCNGHGTHVASVVGGLTFGVAKNASLHALRMLDCAGGGTVSGALQALDWAVANASKPSVLTLSLVGDSNTALDAGVNAAREANLLVVSAAGNAAVDACDYSPGRASGSVTVAASDADDDLLYQSAGRGSNYGSCVTIIAPGTNILGADYVSDAATKFRSGTSQAVPFVAGLAALLIENGTNTADALEDKIVAAASKDQISSTIPDVTIDNSGTPNLLLFTLVDDAVDSAGISPAQAPALAQAASTPAPDSVSGALAAVSPSSDDDGAEAEDAPPSPANAAPSAQAPPPPPPATLLSYLNNIRFSGSATPPPPAPAASILG